MPPLKTKGLIEDWYDRRILPGQEFREHVDNNLEDADIICLFISANFLASPACIGEKEDAIKLKKEKGIVVIPIILSPCGWSDDEEISQLLALPTDGKPVTSFPNLDDAWHDIYNGLKKAIERVIKIKQLTITEDFSDFLQSTELLTKAHSKKEEILLDDVFIYPELTKYDELGGYEEKINSEELIKESFSNYSKILIAGENQSGKTSLCKKIFIELRNKNFVPVYISDGANQYRGKIANKISKAFKKQYVGAELEEIDKNRIVPIIDDFHLAKNKEKHIRDLSKYNYLILVVDDIFSLNIADGALISSFTRFKIDEFVPSLRYELVKKWSYISHREDIMNDANNGNYKEIDKRIELVDYTLGKAIGKGIMPAYPFFILSVIATYETFAVPLNEEITSQGHCYQALIYLYLRKQGVKNDEVDIYINFLTEFSFYLFKESKNELSNDEFKHFMESYLDAFNFPVKLEILLKNLRQAQIISIDSFNNYSFRYVYLYYFFVAKYLAEHLDDNKKIVDSIVKNLHKDENAYIAIFMAHHSKNIDFLDSIVCNAKQLFDKYEPATLTKKELKFFDERADIIVKAVLPPLNTTPEEERIKRLKIQDKLEEINDKTEEDDDSAAELRELRRSIKTVEVMGSIIKNRAGSLEKCKLEEIFREAIKVHFRLLTSFFELIMDEETEKEFVTIISKMLDKKITEEKTKKMSYEKMERISKTIFWNLNFIFIYGVIYKTIHSLGSDKLKDIVRKVCDTEGTPTSFLVKHGIFMWYDKNLQINNIVERIRGDEFSDIAKGIMKHMIVNYSSLHKINYKDMQRIESRLGIPRGRLLKDPKRD